jgi:ABC-type phosphate/phosphonate transport system permease subunit
MKDYIENNDGLKDLIREKGLLSPSEDLTQRIIGFLEESRELKFGYKPLVNKNTWWIIAAVFLGIVYLCWKFTSLGPKTMITQDFLNTLRNFREGIDLSFNFNYNALLIITLAMLSMGILLAIDFWFDSRSGRKVAG